ncbi:MAG: hypothetical protein KAR54_01395, partial [Candidatus Pacebacteria bacterium]|nr:hypothetical protein [Candidatus Paceibacterota bacterium]
MDDTTKSIIFILIGLGIVWILIGGPARMKSKDDLFIRPLAPGEEAETYGKIEFGKESKDNEIISIPEQTEQSSVVGSPSTETTTVDENTSPYKGKIEISKSYGSKSDVDQEYIKLKVNNISDEAIQISDWKLRSGITGTETTIGNAVKLPYTSQQNTASAIFVYSRNEIIITTGRSPIGFSFLVNKCSGYLEQFQDFVPNISKQCPLAEDENIPSYELRIFNDECWDFIDSISKCETPSNYPL